MRIYCSHIFVLINVGRLRIVADRTWNGFSETISHDRVSMSFEKNVHIRTSQRGTDHGEEWKKSGIDEVDRVHEKAIDQIQREKAVE